MIHHRQPFFLGLFNTIPVAQPARAISQSHGGSEIEDGLLTTTRNDSRAWGFSYQDFPVPQDGAPVR